MKWKSLPFSPLYLNLLYCNINLKSPESSIVINIKQHFYLLFYIQTIYSAIQLSQLSIPLQFLNCQILGQRNAASRRWQNLNHIVKSRNEESFCQQMALYTFTFFSASHCHQQPNPSEQRTALPMERFNKYPATCATSFLVLHVIQC